MTQWANLLIPAGSVIAGGLVTGGLTLWGQALVNKGTHAREREARHDAFRVRQREIERDALLALQDALSEHFMIRGRLRAGVVTLDEVVIQLSELHLRIMTLATRVPTVVASAANAYLGGSTLQDLPSPQRSEITKLMADAQLRAGQALMEDL